MEELEWPNQNPVTLSDALNLAIPEEKCFVYKLEVGGETYIGFTTQEPKLRIEQHLLDANSGSELKVHVQLRKFANLYDLEILAEEPNEILGLVREISFIKKLNPSLNLSSGGEGKKFQVFESKSENGEVLLYVKNKSLEKKSKQSKKVYFEKREIRHQPEKISSVLDKIELRFNRKEAQFSEALRKFVKSQIPIVRPTSLVRSHVATFNTNLSCRLYAFQRLNKPNLSQFIGDFRTFLKENGFIQYLPVTTIDTYFTNLESGNLDTYRIFNRSNGRRQSEALKSGIDHNKRVFNRYGEFTTRKTFDSISGKKSLNNSGRLFVWENWQSNRLSLERCSTVRSNDCDALKNESWYSQGAKESFFIAGDLIYLPLRKIGEVSKKGVFGTKYHQFNEGYFFYFN